MAAATAAALNRFAIVSNSMYVNACAATFFLFTCLFFADSVSFGRNESVKLNCWLCSKSRTSQRTATRRRRNTAHKPIIISWTQGRRMLPHRTCHEEENPNTTSNLYKLIHFNYVSFVLTNSHPPGQSPSIVHFLVRNGSQFVSTIYFDCNWQWPVDCFSLFIILVSFTALLIAGEPRTSVSFVRERSNEIHGRLKTHSQMPLQRASP